ncbi:hypothetical protein CDL12_09127 [Handroanthus impetiginosus]|uniref:DEVIL-like protein n=1 Tax=Handroanthus impetiginosus TaxID=429701 RepID=A0A2G9HL11_9LAMI|nr:hypothetical protein CDL12_09127 [Handroanthus impetiginosus]
MAESEKRNEYHQGHHRTCSVSCRSFGQKCSQLAKNQRAKFYILRRCIMMLVCWRDRNEA